MKRKDKHTDRTQDLEKMLSKARKQPGISEAMEVYTQINDHMICAEAYLEILTRRTFTSLGAGTTV